MPKYSHAQVTDFMPPAVVLVGALFLGLPIFFTGQWDRLLLGLLGLLLAALLGLWLARAYPVVAWPWFISLVGFVLLLLGSSFAVSRLPELVTEAWMPWLFGVLTLLLVASWSAVAANRRLTLCWLLVTQTVSAAAALVYLVIDAGTRAGGWLSNANALGGYLLWSIFLLLSLTREQRFRRWVWPTLAIVTAAWLTTVSLTAGAAAIVPGLMWLWWRRSKRFSWKRMLLTVVGLVLAVVTVIAVARSSFLTTTHIRTSFSQRQEFIRTGLRMWSARPWFGWGLGSYQLTSPRFSRQALEQPRYAHNLYVQLLAETGLVGLLAWLSVVVALGWAGWRAVRFASEEDRSWFRGLWLGWLAFTLHAGLDFSWQFLAGQLWWWVAGGIFIGRNVNPGRLRLTSEWRIRLPALAIILWLLWLSGRLLLSQNALARADRLANQDNQAAAIAGYEQSRRWSINRDNILGLSKQLWVRGQPDDLALAADLLDRALAANPDDYALDYALGHVRLSQGKKSEARQVLSEAYRLEPLFHPEYAADYARLLVDLGQPETARTIVTRTLDLYRQNPRSREPAIRPALVRLESLYRQLVGP